MRTFVEKLDYKLLLLKIQVLFCMTPCCLVAEDNSHTEGDATPALVC